MKKIFAVVNQKGGVSKTTTALALGQGLAFYGHSVLMIDLDAQCNLTFTAGVTEDCDGTVRELLLKEANASDIIRHTSYGDVIASSTLLSGMDAVLTETGKEWRLKETLESIVEKYEFIVIDTPPALSILTINALTACTSVIIPVQADIYSLQGVEHLSDTISLVRKYSNNTLHIEGILLTRYSQRSVLSREAAELAGELAERLGTKLFRTTIREAVAVKEAQISQQSLFEYAPKANVTGDYRAFIEELLSGDAGRENG